MRAINSDDRAVTGEPMKNAKRVKQENSEQNI